jgi:hypothetical protein
MYRMPRKKAAMTKGVAENRRPEGARTPSGVCDTLVEYERPDPGMPTVTREPFEPIL